MTPKFANTKAGEQLGYLLWLRKSYGTFNRALAALHLLGSGRSDMTTESTARELNIDLRTVRQARDDLLAQNKIRRDGRHLRPVSRVSLRKRN